MPGSTDRFALVLVTAGSDAQAEEIARALVERRLAACVNIVGEVCSVYRWKGKIEREAEKLLVIKTSRELFPEVRDAVRELHSYETPEILMLPIEDGDAGYLAWLAAEISPAGD